MKTKLANQSSKLQNLFLSILLAFLGSLLGFIGVYLCYFYLHSVSLIFISILPILSFKGYQLGKAIVDKKATIVSIVFSSIQVLIFGLICLLQGDNIIEQLKSCYLDLILVVLFYFLGLWASKRYITDTIENKIKEIDKL